MSIRLIALALFSLLAIFLFLGCPQGTVSFETTPEQSSRHPLDPLSVEELSEAVELLRTSGRVDDDTRYPIINLHEPPKVEVLSWEEGESFRRAAFAVVKQGTRSFEAIIDLTGREVTSWREVQGQPNMMESEMVGAGEIIKSNPDWQEAMRRRGITDFDAVVCLVVTPGYYGIAEEESRRVGKVICFDPRGATNFWGRPIEGLTSVVDLDSFEVIRVIDTGPVPVPSAPVDIDEESVGSLREIPTPISVEQLDGPSFEVKGQQVSWQKWYFHFRVDPRVGLVVSRVRYADGDRERSILYQGALSELIVPYMDPDIGWYFRTYMDAGEFLVGALAVSLEPGLDCPGNAVYFNAPIADELGNPVTKERAACLFERYAGNAAWRHWDFLSGETEVRRKRDLVLRMVAAIGNYDYTFDWTFQQDGAIQVAVGLSGMEQVKAVASRAANDENGNVDMAYGRFVAEHTVAVNHDHFFNFRLDLDVDGTSNSFLREDLKTVAVAEESPRKSVWVIDRHVAKRENQAKLRINLEKPALWRVINPDVLGPVGYPRSYEIKPDANAVSLLLPDDFPQRRAGFIDHHLWVTPYQAEERYAAGPYPAQSKGGDGLPAWTSSDRTIERTDIVVWYTLGFHHVVRAEDWPVLPTSWKSFELRPFDFFDRNPALDLPQR